MLTSAGSFIRIEHNTGPLGGVEGHIRSCRCLWGCGGWGGGGLSHLLWVLMYWNVLQCKCLHKNNFLKPSLEMHKNLTCSVHSWGQIVMGLLFQLQCAQNRPQALQPASQLAAKGLETVLQGLNKEDPPSHCQGLNPGPDLLFFGGPRGGCIWRRWDHPTRQSTDWVALG